MDTLFALAFTIGILQGHAAPPATPAEAVERREVKVDKRPPRRKSPPAPSLGY